MRVHSVIGLVSNSSGEVFIARRDQVPENVDELIRQLWTIWYNQIADEYDKKWFEPPADFDAAELFRFDSIDNEDDIHYGRNQKKSDVIRSFLRELENTREDSWLPGATSRSTVDRLLENHPDVQLLGNYYLELQHQWFNERKEDNPDNNFWIWEATEHVAQMAVDADLFDEFEEIAKYLAMGEGAFGQWKHVARDFEMYHRYQDAELQGEVDDHIYPQDFVRYVCDTLGWFTYHNG